MSSSVSDKRISRSRSRSPRDKKHQHAYEHTHVHEPHHHHKSHRISDIVAQRETAFCSEEESLGDACDILVSSGRSAAVVLDKRGEPCGVLTENDMLAALMDGSSRDLSIDLWLRGGSARMPGYMLQTISPKASLLQAAEIMAQQAEKDSGYACHHLLVEPTPHHKPRLLSALDIARSIMGNLKDKDEAHAAQMKVKKAMKNRGNLAICRLGDKLSQAYRVMSESRQNCVLVVEGLGDVDGENLVSTEQEGRHVHGCITAADALRTFSECQDGENTTVLGWLRGLTAEEHVTAPKRTINESKTLSEAAEHMTETGVHHLVVLGQKGNITGVLSALDVVCALGERKSFKAGGA
eukprot:TRINITY_DN93634_c0_g1_i1.p1 TRINITY_DN93634_c0_g1~~TRINITY_DN93634_c0_g1_i1.p1  ORF type:complete len:352 (+),score=50.11 TRINITY_DN93634_c0_g1_i1:80-1135(+)